MSVQSKTGIVPETENTSKFDSAVTCNIDQIYDLEIKLLNPDPNQPRSYFDQNVIDAITSTLKNGAGIYNPILVRMGDDGKIYIIGGEQRYRAALAAGLQTVPVIFKTGNTTDISIWDNILRSDLTPLETAEAYKQLKDQHNLNSKKLAGMVGKAQSTVSQILSLNNLPNVVKDELKTTNDYTRDELLTITGKCKSAQSMIDAFAILKANKKINIPVVDLSKQFLAQIKIYNKKITDFEMPAEDHPDYKQIIEALNALNDLISSIVKNH